MFAKCLAGRPGTADEVANVAAVSYTHLDVYKRQYLRLIKESDSAHLSR